MTRERNKPQGTTLERIDKDYEKVIPQRYKDFKDGYNKAVDKACEWLKLELTGWDFTYGKGENYEFVELFKKALMMEE